MSSAAYAPGVFDALASTVLGKGLWELLNEPESRIRMRTASDLGRPALEAVEEPLLERFGEQVLEDRVKQMVGHMARQVMETEGYVIDAQNVKMTGGAPFSRATRYKRREAMTFHVWRLRNDSRSLALTADKAGGRLPAAVASQWEYWKSLDGALRVCIALGLPDVARARAEIAANGYCLHRMERMLRAAYAPQSPPTTSARANTHRQ